MSFAREVREELAHVQVEKDCCRIAELVALMRMNGNLLLAGNNAVGLVFVANSSVVARKFLALIKRNNGNKIPTEVMISRHSKLKKHNKYIVRLTPSVTVRELLIELGILGEQLESAGKLNFGKDSLLLKKSCCRQSYLRGAFVGGGSVSRPSVDYHLEFLTSNEAFADSILKVLKSFSIEGRKTLRGKYNIVYLKNSEKIASFFTVTGAYQTLLNFENIRIVRGMRNQVNRTVNCETANLQKVVNTAFRQVEKIKKIIEVNGIESLTFKLREAAEVRLNNPESSIAELCEVLEGKITKAGLSHRLRKLEKIHDELFVGG